MHRDVFCNWLVSGERAPAGWSPGTSNGRDRSNSVAYVSVKTPTVDRKCPELDECAWRVVVSCHQQARNAFVTGRYYARHSAAQVSKTDKLRAKIAVAQEGVTHGTEQRKSRRHVPRATERARRKSEARRYLKLLIRRGVRLCFSVAFMLVNFFFFSLFFSQCARGSLARVTSLFLDVM